MEKKTYLMPRIIRRGSPTMSYVVSDGKLYWLGTYHGYMLCCKDGRVRLARGDGREYARANRVRISRELYLAYCEESKRNYKFYRVSA
jgi:hypothetical protein